MFPLTAISTPAPATVAASNEVAGALTIPRSSGESARTVNPSRAVNVRWERSPCEVLGLAAPFPPAASTSVRAAAGPLSMVATSEKIAQTDTALTGAISVRPCIDREADVVHQPGIENAVHQLHAAARIVHGEAAVGMHARGQRNRIEVQNVHAGAHGGEREAAVAVGLHGLAVLEIDPDSRQPRIARREVAVARA
jgi:hypothetical protein